MAPQNHRDGKHPDAVIKDFRAWLDNTQGATHRVALYNGTWECMKQESHNKTYISDKQLHTMELCIYLGINVQLDGLDGECISQMCRYTGGQSWRRRHRRNDWVCEKLYTGSCYGALNGCLLWQLQRLFTIERLNEDGGFVEYWIAMVLTTIPEYSGNLDLILKFVEVRKAPGAYTFQVFSVGNIVGCAHVFPEITTSSTTRDGRNER